MAEALIYGVISGLEIALLAAAFQLAYLPTRVFFIGLAGIYALAPYLFAAAVAYIPAPAAVLATGLACAALAAFLEVANHAPLARRHSADTAHLLSSLGVYVILVQLISIFAGSGAQSLPGSLTAAGLDVGPVAVSQSDLLIFAVSLILLAALALLLTRTDLGVRLRAFAANPDQMRLNGFQWGLYRIFAFGLSGALAAAASLLRANDSGFDPFGGLSALLLAVVAVIVGGRGSFIGPVVGGLVLGLVRTNVAWFLEARWADAASFGLLCLILLLRPSGLVGPKYRIEAV